MGEVIARLELVGELRLGGRVAIVVEVGRPEPLGGPNNDWRCPVSVTPLMDRVLPVKGVDALHALSSAIDFAASLLTGFVRDHGRLVYPDSGEAYDVETMLNRP